MSWRIDESDAETDVVPSQGARSTIRRQPRIAWRDAAGDHAVTLGKLALVGSTSRADLVVEDPTVSRLHAELEPRHDGLWVRDLGSRNGTWIEGVQVREARVPDGGRIRVGSTVLSVDAAVETSIELWPDARFGALVGGSVEMRELFAILARVAALESTVLIEGETGTGKELVARALHDASPRAGGPFVVVDCAALPEQLLESELFGHVKGSFTGATSTRVGALEAAAGGTVFLDEIGELTPSVQPKLLRALESRTIRRIGESAHRPIDVRFVSATHRDLRQMVSAGSFREDLYFRLAVLPVSVPPLRTRMDDVVLLIDHFCQGASDAFRTELLREALDRPWPGNVRELRNFVERAVAFGARQAAAMSGPRSEPAPAPSRPGDLAGSAFAKPFREFRDEMERAYVQRLLERHGGNVQAAAQAAGLDRTYIYRLLKKHEA